MAQWLRRASQNLRAMQYTVQDLKVISWNPGQVELLVHNHSV